MKKNEWHWQYLEGEKFWYLTELHKEDGILGEYFFMTEVEMDDFIKENNITLKYEKFGLEELNEIVDEAAKVFDDGFPPIGKVESKEYNDMYHIGKGCYTGHLGYLEFMEELYKQAMDKDNWVLNPAVKQATEIALKDVIPPKCVRYHTINKKKDE